MITTALCGIFLIGYTTAQGAGYVATGVGPGFGFMQPFPPMMPPLMMPQIPMPYMPMMVPNTGVATGGTVVSRFGPDGESGTYIAANPYGGYTYTSGSTYSYPSQGQTVLDSRFNENDGSESHSVHTSHISTFSSPKSGSSTHKVYTQTSHATPTSYSSSSNGGDAYTDVRPISTGRGGAAQTSIGHSSSNNGGSAHTEYKPGHSGSYSGGGSTQTAYAPAYPSSVGTSSFTSSTNVNGQQETVSSINNNGYVQTYRQTNGK